MLKTVMWIAAACVAVLLALFVSRGLHLDRPPAAAPEAPVVAPVAAPPPAAVAPVAPPPAPAPPAPPEDQQVQDDAAATGMTTLEPEPAPPT